MDTRLLARIRSLLCCLLILTLIGSEAWGQQAAGHRVVPTNHVVLSGYGTAGYLFKPQGIHENAFRTGISPIFLYQFQDRVLFESELEFELSEGVTETGLEYAQVDVFLNDNLTFVGGKFLLPFGVFGERLHPTWINKFPTHPPIYGHDEPGFGTAPILPILSDVGLMLRGAVAPGPWQLALSAYVSQGPAAEEGAADEVPEWHFPASSGDNNTGKAVGGRVDLVLPPLAEVDVSVLHGTYDDASELGLTGWNIAGELHKAGVEIRGEYLQTRQAVDTPGGIETLVRDGFYIQSSYRWRPWEPVFRWTQAFDGKLGGVTEVPGAWQAGFGLDYWISPSIAVMGAYELNREKEAEVDNDRIVIHIAFGF
jgi:hypothetical protein